MRRPFITIGEALTFNIGLLFGYITSTTGWIGFLLSLSGICGGVGAALWAHERRSKRIDE